MGYTDHKRVSLGHIQRLMSMGPDELVRVYTRQDPRAWDEAVARGYLTGSHGAGDDEVNGHFEYPYEWMRRQMAERIPDFSGDLPVWTWLKRQNERKWVTSWDAKERKTLPIFPRVIALVPRKRMLLSCYEMWHAHLNNWHISDGQEEDEAYEAKWPTYKAPGSDPIYQAETETHWPKVFDIHLPRSPYMVEMFGQVDRVQACVDRIYLDEVQSVRWLS